MRIGIDISKLSDNLDGIGIYLYDLIQYFNEMKTDDAYYLYSDRPLIVDLRLDERFEIKIDKSSNHFLWLLAKLPKYLKQDKVDIYWQPNHIAPIKIKNIDNIVTICDLSAYRYGYGSWKTNLIHKTTLRRTCKIAKRIICISEATKKDLIQCIPVNPDCVQVIYIGDCPFKEGYTYDELEIKKIFKKYRIPSKPYFLFVGTLNPRKNIEVIVKAFIKFREKYNMNISLVMAGAVGWGNENALNTIQNSNYKNDIVITGYVTEEEKKVLYFNADALLFPSRLEGFGFPLLEAMAANIPAITSRNSSLPEIGGEAVLYLNDIDSAAELACLMNKVETMNSGEKEAMLAKGTARAKLFSRKKAAEQTYQIFEDIYRAKI